MRKTAQGLLLGGALGAGVVAARSLRDDDPARPLAPRVATAVVMAAAVGGAIGWYLDRQDRIRLARTPRGALAVALAGAGHVAEGALPAIQHAADLAARRAVDAAGTARPHLESAAGTARSRAGEAAGAARPYVESAADTLRARAGDVAGAARPHLESAAGTVRTRVGEAAGAARPLVESAADTLRGR